VVKSILASQRNWIQPRPHQASCAVQCGDRVRVDEGIVAPDISAFGVNNLTDRLYLFNYLSIFSGTHIGRRVSSSGDHVPPARALGRQRVPSEPALPAAVLAQLRVPVGGGKVAAWR